MPQATDEYGGVAVEDSPQPDEFGGVPVEETPPALNLSVPQAIQAGQVPVNAMLRTLTAPGVAEASEMGQRQGEAQQRDQQARMVQRATAATGGGEAGPVYAASPVNLPRPDVIAGRELGRQGKAITASLGDFGSLITGQPVSEPGVPSNISAFAANQPLPAEYQAKALPLVPRIGLRASQGMIESAPQLSGVAAMQSLGVPAPVAAAVMFGLTPEGFSAKQAALGAALPELGKYGGAITEAIAQKLGIGSEATRSVINKLGGAAGVGALLSADALNHIRKLPSGERKDAIVEAVGNIAPMTILGLAGERTTPERALAPIGAAREMLRSRPPIPIPPEVRPPGQPGRRISPPPGMATLPQALESARGIDQAVESASIQLPGGERIAGQPTRTLSPEAEVALSEALRNPPEEPPPSAGPAPPVPKTPPPAPQAPVAAAAPKPIMLTPHDLEPALLINGKPVTGGATHKAISDSLMSGDLAPDAIEALANDKQHVFVDKAGNVYTREEAAAALGEKDPLHSERLIELKKTAPKGDAAELSDLMARRAKGEKLSATELDRMRELQAKDKAQKNPADWQAKFKADLEKAKAAQAAEPTVTLYHGEGGTGGTGASGVYWTSNPIYAANQGPQVSIVEVPKSVADAARKAAQDEGSGTPEVHKLGDQWVRKAKPMAKPLAQPVQVIPEETPAEQAKPTLSDGIKNALEITVNKQDAQLGRAAPIKQKNLSDLTKGKPLFHETSLQNAFGIYAGLRRTFKQSWTRFFASTNPDLAIGQEGKGVLFEIDPERVNGWVHAKPGTTETTGFEYNIDRSAVGAINSVTFSSRRQMAEFQKRFPGYLDFSSAENTERGIRVPVRRAGAGVEPAAGAPPPAEPSPAPSAAPAVPKETPAEQAKPIPATTGKAQKKYVLDEVAKAIEEAPEGTPEVIQDRYGSSEEALQAVEIANAKLYSRNAANFGTVKIEVPGDGTFNILNVKSALKDFQERAKKFPTSATHAKKISVPSSEPKSPAPIGSGNAKETAAALAAFVSDDPQRPVLANAFSDGKTTVSTDGRHMLIIEKGSGGTPKKPIAITPEGKPVTLEKDLKIPDYKRVIPKNTETWFPNLDTQRLFTLMRQAEQATSDKSVQVYLFKNPDGSLGIRSGTEGEAFYEHNVNPGAKTLTALNPSYVIDAINAMRRLGHDKVTISGIDEVSPMVIRAPGVKSIIMPMRIEGNAAAENIRAAVGPDAAVPPPAEGAPAPNIAEENARMAAELGQEVQDVPTPANEPPAPESPSMGPGGDEPTPAFSGIPLPGMEGIDRRIDNVFQSVKTRLKARPVRHLMDSTFDAIGNMARVVGRKAARHVNIGISKSQDVAASAAIAANFDPANLPDLLQKAIKGKNKEAADGVRLAMAQWETISNIAKRGQRLFDAQIRAENAVGINTLHHEAYLPGVYDMDLLMGNGRPFVIAGSGSGGVASGFKKGKTFATPFDAIAEGYKPKSMRLSDLVEHRVVQGTKMINKIRWGKILGDAKDPTDGKPVLTNLQTRSRPDGSHYEVAPLGYTPREILPGMRFAVHEGYSKLYDALTGHSRVSEFEPGGIPVGALALEAGGAIKHGLLAFDTFHANRVMMRQLFLTGRVGYGKGLSLLEYSPVDLERAVANKEITPETANYVRANQADAQLLIKSGFNVGRIEEGLYSGVVQKSPSSAHSINGCLKK